VHRLWEPLAVKQRPPNGYAGKFSTPYCIAAAFLRGELGLDDFSDAAVQDPAAVSLASRVRYRIDPANPYPRVFTGHARAVLADGRIIEERQPHLRGGVHEPLTGEDIEAKLRRNARHGGIDDAMTSDILSRLRSLYDADAIDLSFLRG
jgi:2-methylcitrate dehydratase PrpD